MEWLIAFSIIPALFETQWTNIARQKDAFYMHITSLLYLTTFFVWGTPPSDFIFSIFKFITKAQVLKAGLELSMKTYNTFLT